tara:strand:+ start:550 stop:1020 length:471 start_codon:yes stop_codon:yes gene_type:complete
MGITSDSYVAKRKTNLNDLRTIYQNLLVEYDTEYTKFLEAPINSAQQIAAKTKVTNTNLKLNGILDELKNNIKKTNELITTQTYLVNSKTDVIMQKNKDISTQDKYVSKSNIELISKKKQNEFSVERNRYKRVVLVVLVVINILLAWGIYRLYLKA